MKANSIRAIVPYRWNGLWVFDDKETGLVREAFVAGADVICDQLCKGKERFTLLFSDIEFPQYDVHLTLKHRCGVGHTYQTLGQEAWLCPALMLYFEVAPNHIYAKAVPLKGAKEIKKPRGHWYDNMKNFPQH